MENVNKKIGSNIKFYRKEKGLKQKELAEKMNIPNSTFSEWENGKHAIDIAELIEICDILEVSLNQIIGIEEKTIENKIKKEFNKLNKKGKTEAEKRIKELTYIPEYTQKEDFLKEQGSIS